MPGHTRVLPVPTLQGHSCYKAGGLCEDVVVVSSQSLKEMPATGQREKSSLFLLWLLLIL